MPKLSQRAIIAIAETVVAEIAKKDAPGKRASDLKNEIISSPDYETMQQLNLEKEVIKKKMEVLERRISVKYNKYGDRISFYSSGEVQVREIDQNAIYGGLKQKIIRELVIKSDVETITDAAGLVDELVLKYNKTEPLILKIKG